MKIKVLYFAQLADLAGKAEEARMISNPSPEALYSELRDQYQFPHEFREVQVAVNRQLSAHDAVFRNGDNVAFLPPMTGG